MPFSPEDKLVQRDEPLAKAVDDAVVKLFSLRLELNYNRKRIETNPNATLYGYLQEVTAATLGEEIFRGCNIVQCFKDNDPRTRGYSHFCVAALSLHIAATEEEKPTP